MIKHSRKIKKFLVLKDEIVVVVTEESERKISRMEEFCQLVGMGIPCHKAFKYSEM